MDNKVNLIKILFSLTLVNIKFEEDLTLGYDKPN